MDVQIKMTEPETVAYVQMKGSYDQIPSAFAKLYGWIAERGLRPSGPPRAVYVDPPETAGAEPSWEVQAPVEDSAAEQECGPDGCGVKRVDSGQVASTVFTGSYDRLAEVYEALQKWVDDMGFKMDGPPVEVYYSDPDDTPIDESITEIRFPVTKH